MVFAIRPHDLKINNSQNKAFLKAKLLSSEYLGSETHHHFQVGRQRILVVIPLQQKTISLQKNSSYSLDISVKKIFFFKDAKDGENITASVL